MLINKQNLFSYPFFKSLVWVSSEFAARKACTYTLHQGAIDDGLPLQGATHLTTCTGRTFEIILEATGLNVLTPYRLDDLNKPGTHFSLIIQALETTAITRAIKIYSAGVLAAGRDDTGCKIEILKAFAAVEEVLNV